LILFSAAWFFFSRVPRTSGTGASINLQGLNKNKNQPARIKQKIMKDYSGKISHNFVNELKICSRKFK